MTKSNDGWIKHDGVVPGYPWQQIKPDVKDYDFVEVSNGFAAPNIMIAKDADWRHVRYWRRAAPKPPAPSDFVRETAARIMAAAWPAMGGGDDKLAVRAVAAAMALEAELGRIGK